MEKTSCGTYDTDVEINQRTGAYSECCTEKIKNKRKSPVIAALLSCIVPGLGQVYAGDLLRGFAMLAALGISLCLMALIIGFFTFIGTWIFAIVDAYNMVKKQNNKTGAPQVVS